MSQEIKKRERGANYTPEEKRLLANLILQYKHIIDDKHIGGLTIKKKREAWKIITSKYNSSNCFSGCRTTEQLKGLYDNLKQQSRRKRRVTNNAEQNMSSTGSIEIEDDLVEVLKNVKEEVEIHKGSGFWIPPMTKTNSNQINPLSNPYDSASVYFKDNINLEQGNDSPPNIVELDQGSSAAQGFSEIDNSIQMNQLSIEDIDSLYSSSSSTVQDQVKVTTPSKAQRKIVEMPTVGKQLKKVTSTETFKSRELYFKKKCQNVLLERKKLMQEILYNKNKIIYMKQEHYLKMLLLKKQLDKFNKE